MSDSKARFRYKNTWYTYKETGCLFSVCVSVCNGITQKRVNGRGCNLYRYLPLGLGMVLG